MARYALISEDTNLVDNVIIWNGAPWKAPAGYFIVLVDGVSIGDIYDPETKTFKKPETGVVE